MSKRARRIEARVAVLEREAERQRARIAELEARPIGVPYLPWPASPVPSPWVPQITYLDLETTGTTRRDRANQRVWRIEGQDVYCEGDASGV